MTIKSRKKFTQQQIAILVLVFGAAFGVINAILSAAANVLFQGIGVLGSGIIVVVILAVFFHYFSLFVKKLE